MNIRQAILKTAELFEAHPKLFKYSECAVPDCGTPGCAIGYVCHFMNCQPGGDIGWYEMDVIGVDASVFYERMSALDIGWIADGGRCSRGMRLYADKYHPVTELVGIPGNVRDIFNMTHEQLQRELITST